MNVGAAIAPQQALLCLLTQDFINMADGSLRTVLPIKITAVKTLTGLRSFKYNVTAMTAQI